MSIVGFYEYIQELMERETDHERKKLLGAIEKGLYDYGNENGNYHSIF